MTREVQRSHVGQEVNLKQKPALFAGLPAGRQSQQRGNSESPVDHGEEYLGWHDSEDIFSAARHQYVSIHANDPSQ